MYIETQKKRNDPAKYFVNSSLNIENILASKASKDV